MTGSAGRRRSSACFSASASASSARPVARNLILVTVDGLRWQEVFGGFDPILNTKEGGGVPSPLALDRRWR